MRDTVIPAMDGRRASRRQARADRRRRPLAAAEVLGDAVHQVASQPTAAFRRPRSAGPPAFAGPLLVGATYEVDARLREIRAGIAALGLLLVLPSAAAAVGFVPRATCARCWPRPGRGSTAAWCALHETSCTVVAGEPRDATSIRFGETVRICGPSLHGVIQRPHRDRAAPRWEPLDVRVAATPCRGSRMASAATGRACRPGPVTRESRDDGARHARLAGDVTTLRIDSGSAAKPALSGPGSQDRRAPDLHALGHFRRAPRRRQLRPGLRTIGARPTAYATSCARRAPPTPPRDPDQSRSSAATTSSRSSERSRTSCAPSARSSAIVAGRASSSSMPRGSSAWKRW